MTDSIFASRVAAPVPPGTDAAAELAIWSGFGPKKIAPRHIFPFAGAFPMRMRGLEPVLGGLAPPGRTEHESTRLSANPRKTGVFRSPDVAGAINTQHDVAGLSAPDLVPIWSEGLE